MSKISIMDEILANKIAAGEVVERCMNVVKELVENAVDAKSNIVKIELVDSGVKEIKVTDNGIGMDKEDAVLAFSRHATSKLKVLDDLFDIETLGFRGEALPSIASVSNVVLKTSNGIDATEVVIDGGHIKDICSSDLREGTTITVKNLFYNTPVRLKYLKNLYTELAHITDYVNKMALSFPNISFTLINNNKTILSTDGSGNLLKVIHSIYGLDVVKKMVSISISNDDYKVSGYISYPELSRSNRNSITTLVNGRVIKNNELNKIIIDSYHTYMPPDKFPIVVLNIEVDPSIVDINIHPTKMDIKFSKINELKDLIHRGVSDKLTKLTLIPEVKYEKKEKPIYYNNFEEEKEETSFLNDIKDEEVPLFKEEVTFNFEVNDEKTEYNEGEKRIKKMFPIGLVHGTYIIAENEDGMYILDQHAAAERINYEKVLDKLIKPDNKKTDLLIPIKIELSNSEYIILKENFNILEKLGFVLEEFGVNTILVRSHPTWLSDFKTKEAIEKIVRIVIEKEDFSHEVFIDRIAATMACKMSIKGNSHITLEDMEILLDNLRKTKNPFTCPHGRPTIISYSKYELERMFKRVMN